MLLFTVDCRRSGFIIVAKGTCLNAKLCRRTLVTVKAEQALRQKHNIRFAVWMNQMYIKQMCLSRQHSSMFCGLGFFSATHNPADTPWN